MKYFVVEIIYTAPIEQIEATTSEHRNYLKQGYEKGFLLLSGPKIPRNGGIVIAKFESLEAITEFFKNDPYQSKNLAEYKITEFMPKNFQENLKNWIEEIS